jgi:CubicO group peptidase (beta-lactamase class C family)
VFAVGAVECELEERAPRKLATAVRAAADLLDGAIEAGYPPGASLVVVDADGTLARLHGGRSCVVGEEIETTGDTVYDLASLTKVLATVTLSLVLAERGAWSLDDPVATWVDGFPRGDTTLRQLLTHTSGLVPHREFYRLGRGVAAIRPLVLAEVVDAVAGPVSYSDLGYMLLGWAIEQCAGPPFEQLVGELVTAPLGMSRTRFRPPASARRGIAATELDGDQRLEPGLVWGEVHDGNAWALGGIAGHAGLFAPAEDLALFLRAFLAPDRHPVLGAASIAEMTRRQAGAPPDTRALGWRLDAGDWGRWGPAAFWHTGFTGTSLLVDPDAGLGVVLLLGGIHPVRRLDDQEQLRRRVHRALSEAV